MSTVAAAAHTGRTANIAASSRFAETIEGALLTQRSFCFSQGNLNAPCSFFLRSTDGRPMTDMHEKQLADEIDREVSDKGGLIALVLCLAVAGGLLIAGAMALFPAG